MTSYSRLLLGALWLAAGSLGCEDEFVAGPVDAGGPPCYPNDPVNLRDDFQGTELGVMWAASEEGDATVAIVDGKLRLSPAPNTASSTAAVFSELTFDLRSCSVWVEVPTVLPPTPGLMTSFGVLVDGGNMAAFSVLQGSLSVDVVVDGAGSGVNTKPYDPVAHRWWRVREHAGTTYFDTARDGVSWTEFAHYASPAYIDEVRLLLHATAHGTVPDPGWAEFDNVDVVP